MAMRLSSVPINCPVSVHMIPSSVGTQNFQQAFCLFESDLFASIYEKRRQKHMSTLTWWNWKATATMTTTTMSRRNDALPKWQKKYLSIEHLSLGEFCLFFVFFFCVASQAFNRWTRIHITHSVMRWQIQYLISSFFPLFFLLSFVILMLFYRE